MTIVEDLGKDQAILGCVKTHPPPQHIVMGCQTELLPCNKEGQGHVVDGPDQGMTS